MSAAKVPLVTIDSHTRVVNDYPAAGLVTMLCDFAWLHAWLRRSPPAETNVVWCRASRGGGRLASLVDRWISRSYTPGGAGAPRARVVPVAGSALSAASACRLEVTVSASMTKRRSGVEAA